MSKTYTNHKGIKAALNNPPTNEQEEVKDSTCKGLYLRIQPTGNAVFIHRYKINGGRRVYTYEELPLAKGNNERQISEALTKARAIHATQRAEIKAGNDPAIERDLKAHQVATMPTVTAFTETFINRYMKGKKSAGEYRRILTVDVLPIVGNMPLDKVERKHVIGLLDRKQDAGATVARNMLIAVLSKFFNFAIERALLDRNPVTGIKKTKTKSRERVLSNREIGLLWDYTDPATSRLEPATRLALRLVLVTGQRAGEVCQMQEKQLSGNWWRMTDTKNGKTHDVYLTPTALQIIGEARPHGRRGYLFVDTNGNMKEEKTLAQSMSKWAIAWDENTEGKPTPHDLRRTFTTGLGALGFNRFVQNLVTNHADSSVGGIYDRHTYAKDKQQAQEAWERLLIETIGGIP
jgi:Site-specific recombinase XerD